MDAITKAVAKEDLLNLARLAGATDINGGNIASGTICFTSAEFEDFIARLFAHQEAILETYSRQRRPVHLGDDVSLSDAMSHLSEQLGVER